MRLAEMMRRALDRRIEIVHDAAARLAVVGDETSFEQVVMNLMINARDAMPDGGTLTLRTREEVVEVVGDAAGEVADALHPLGLAGADRPVFACFLGDHLA